MVPNAATQNAYNTVETRNGVGSPGDTKSKISEQQHQQQQAHSRQGHNHKCQDLPQQEIRAPRCWKRRPARMVICSPSRRHGQRGQQGREKRESPGRRFPGRKTSSRKAQGYTRSESRPLPAAGSAGPPLLWIERWLVICEAYPSISSRCVGIGCVHQHLYRRFCAARHISSKPLGNDQYGAGIIGD